MIQRMNRNERASMAQAATVCLYGGNIAAVGNNVARVVGMSGPIGVLVFNGDEDSVCEFVHGLAVVHGVQAE